ncbi:hypothetical protein [Catellatospora tritici]|uniref:hypothetical protein n=1 Tax=Catellatospora tritici TaxID=2851566 RepID=UPI001C2DEAE9|nr:hypothetical protein [Catellatospora tritici]MBV1854244.1 hypothetical protein [Catellatospora tritici]
MRPVRLLTVFVAALAGGLLLPAPASAHPLGNFSVNQLVALTVRPATLHATVVVDLAELPTLQDRTAVDASGDGLAEPAELSAYARRSCADVARDVTVTSGSARLGWTLDSAVAGYAPGAAGLSTSRVTCTLRTGLPGARVELSVHNGFRADRVGWREITVAGAGVTATGTTPSGAILPAHSGTDELRVYPTDPLASPLDVRDARLDIRPGAATATDTDTDTAAATSTATGADTSTGSTATPLRLLGWAQERMLAAVGGSELTPLVGVLAVLLALLLGAAHALLPGHGKTVMAVYLAGRAGRPRDALTVGITVTATHTGGVIVLGLVLTVVSGLTGQTILGWLGVASGAIVTAVGLGMLLPTLRHSHPHPHPHPHPRPHSGDSFGETAGKEPSIPAVSPKLQPTHGHAHDAHAHAHAHAHGHVHGHGHAHGHGHGGHRHRHGGGGGGRVGIGALGVAAGLVPSPSALVVLLGAIALGRTGFGILLVLAYGVGMAATLTAAGLLLLRLRDRWSARLSRFRPLVTAGPAVAGLLVLVVGLGLAARSAALIPA